MNARDMSVVVMVIASGIVLLGWAVAVVLLTLLMNRTVRDAEAREPGLFASQPHDLLFYALSVVFWPAALVCCVHFIKQPKTARMGRMCGLLGLAHVSLIVVATCFAMIAFVSYLPGWLR